MVKLFISYARENEGAVERLHTHLAVLERDGKIDSWHDREIIAGGDFADAIDEALATADVFVALVSPDFLASDYCYEKEMGEALRRHEEGTMQVVPVILEPCDWTNTPLKRLKALPKDGKPVSDWTNANTAYLDIVNEIRRIVETSARAKPTGGAAEQDRSRNVQRRYRAKKDFDEVDRGDFRREAFQVISGFFKASVQEINQVDGFRARFDEIGSSGFTCTVVNRGRRNGAAYLTVHMRGGREGLGDIFFSHQENAPVNTANGYFNIIDDEYEMFLHGNVSFMSEQQRVSPRRAAEMLWEDVLTRAGITHE